MSYDAITITLHELSITTRAQFEAAVKTRPKGHADRLASTAVAVMWLWNCN